VTSPEPRFAGIATTIGDPTRARMLAALMGGQFLCAGELAAAAGVSPKTASPHIARLIASELVILRTQARHRYFRLADADVAHALETLSLVAERSAGLAKWEQGAYKALKTARTCYNHLAGELGVALFEGLLVRGALAPVEGCFDLTAKGRAQLQEIGVALPGAPPNAGRRTAYPCLDWSERRDHLAGPLATALLDHCLARQWLRRMPGSRAVLLTPAGRKGLAPWLETSGTVQLASQSS
jgi:DNA-binding transcriptional ArsR family regulator